MCKYSNTTIKHTNNTIHTRRKTKSNAYILKYTHRNTDENQIKHILYICHEVYFYLLQGAEAAEDWVRQWHQLVATETQITVGRKEDRVRLTLVAIAAPSHVSQCVSARVSVCACLPWQPTTSIQHTHHNGHRYANARNMHLKLLAYASYGNV